MKRIVSILVAVCMIFSVCGVVFAADGGTAKVALVVDNAPTKVGDEFNIAVVAKDITAGTLNSAMIQFTYNEEVVAPAYGANNRVQSVMIQRSDRYDADTGEGIWTSVDASADKGVVTYTLYVSPDQEEVGDVSDSGIPVTEDFTVVTFKFRAVGEGNAQIAITADPGTKIIPAPSLKAELSYENPTIVIGSAPAVKTITAIEEPKVQAEATVGDTVALPATVKATVDGEAVELPIVWNPAAVDTTSAGEKKVTGTVTVGDYAVAEGVKTVYEITVKVNEPAPVVKTITAIEEPKVQAEATVGDTVALPATVKATVDGEAVELPIVWNPATVDTTAAGEKKVTGTVTVGDYAVAEGVKTVYEITVTVKDKPVEVKTVGAITAPEVPTTAKVGDTVELPKTVKATVDGEAVELPIVWEPATVDTTSAGEKKVVGTVNTDGYEVAEGVPTTFEVTITVEAVEEPPVEEPDVEIVSVVAPEITVYIGTASDDVKAQLGETVVGLTADGEEVEVNVAWSGTVDTRKAATKTVKGTLTAPEGYVLAKKLTTVTATVHVVKVPADTTIDSVDEIAPITVFAGDKVALPATVVGYVTETKTVDVTVEWPEVDTSVAGVQEITGKLVAPEGYDLAEGLTEVKVIVTVVALAELPVQLDTPYVNEEDGHIILPVSVKADYADYAVAGKTLDAYDKLVVSITYMNGITPVKVASQYIELPEGGNWAGFQYKMGVVEDIPEDADTIQYCVVVGYDPTQPVSITNLGIPVGAARPYVIGE